MLPDGSTVGYVGEHNATTLEITPPDSMLTDGISLLCLAVETGRDFIKAVVRSAMVPKADKINIPLWRQATGSPKAKLQLEAYDDGGNLLIKSPVAEVSFLSSVSGVQNVSSAKDTSLIADIASNTAARHSHENADVLNKLGESGGVLTYGGQEVGEKVTVKSKSFKMDWTEGEAVTKNSGACFYINSVNNVSPLPDNARVIDFNINYNGVEYKSSELFINGIIKNADIVNIYPSPVKNASEDVYLCIFIYGTKSTLYAEIANGSEPVGSLTLHYVEVE